MGLGEPEKGTVLLGGRITAILASTSDLAARSMDRPQPPIGAVLARTNSTEANARVRCEYMADVIVTHKPGQRAG